MFDVGGGELLLIVIAILLLFGPEKLPELARSFGKGMSHLRKAQTEFQRNLNAMADEVDEIVQQQPESGNTTDNTLPKFERYMDSLPQDSAQTPFEAQQPEPHERSTQENSQTEFSKPALVIRPAEHSISTDGNTSTSAAS